MDDWDFEHQKAETFLTVTQLHRDEGVPLGAAIGLDLEFVAAGGAADGDGFRRKLAMFGYHAETGEDADRVRVAVPDLSFDAEAIWLHEERTTRLALLHGFRPDGWGFYAPDPASS